MLLSTSPLLTPLPFLLTLAAVLSLPIAVQAAPGIEDPGRVVAVTVFQGQALVTREIALPEDNGLVEAIVTGLPERLMPGSLYAEPGQGVEVRSVRTRVRPIEETSREEVRELDAQIEELNREMQRLRRRQQVMQQREQYLSRLEQFTAGNTSGDLAKGVLDADALAKLTRLVFTEREEVATQQTELEFEQRELQKEVQLLQRKRQTLTAGRDRSSREAVVFLSKGAGAATLRLTYLVSGASWSPSYNLRADDERSTVTVEYNAQVTQMSGEDWSDVEMTLSTATPSLVATPPTLEPLDIRLVADTARQRGRQSKVELFARQQALASNRSSGFAAPASAPPSAVVGDELEAVERSAPGGFGGVYADDGAALGRFDSTLNRLAGQMQVLDLSGRDARDKSIQPPKPTEGISVVYRLASRTSLPSRSDKQLIQIAALPLEAEFYHVATPVLTSYVYEEAKLANETKTVLLAGPAATFVGDRFVGRGQMPSVSVGESFTIGLGIDESLRASRELVDESDRIQGGNRVATFDYRLAIENFGDAPVTVRLTDRLPKSDGKSVKVTLLGASPEPDAEFAPSKDGFVRWTIEAPGGATGDDAVEATYTLQLEHDKNLVVSGSAD